MSDQSIKEWARTAALKNVYKSYYETLLRNGQYDESDLPEDVASNMSPPSETIDEWAQRTALKNVYKSYYETLLRNGKYDESDLPEDVASNMTSTPIFNMWKAKHESFIEEQEIMNTYVTTEPEAMTKVERVIDMILHVDTEIRFLSDIKLFITNNFNVMAFPSIAKWINDSDRLPKDNRSKPSIDGYPVLSYADHVCIDILQKFEEFKRKMFHASPCPQIYIGELFTNMLTERGQLVVEKPREWKPERYSFE